ncbi:hypothetical protein N7488_007070 [Penicillium malachiteum]|nr:hypothetical protein N7488_007070 [Penicillium malachiteum]
MRTTFALVAAIAALCVKADDSTTTVGFFSPSWDINLYQSGGGWSSTAASLADVKYQTATYHVGCEKGAPKSDCNLPESWTIVQGPDTVSFTGKYIASISDSSYSYDITVTQSYECSLHSSTGSASCTMSAAQTGSLDGAKYESSDSSKTSYKTAPMSDLYYVLPVTAGMSSLTNSIATATGAAATGNAGAMITAAPVVMAAVAAFI